MSVSNTKETKLIALKLNFLKELRGQLVSAVDDYIDKVVIVGNAFINKTENTIEYNNLCQMIERAVECIYLKMEEISETSLTQEVVSLQSTQASTPETRELPDFSSATSYSQTTASLLQSPAEVNRAQCIEVQEDGKVFKKAPKDIDDSMLCQVLARIGVIEEAICSLRNNAENISEKQNGLDSKIIEMSSTLTDSNKTQSEKYNNLNEQVQNLNENQIEIMKEQKTRPQTLEKFEKQLQKMSSKQDGMKEESKSQSEIKDRIKNITDKTYSLEGKISQLSENLETEVCNLNVIVNKLRDDHFDKLQNLEDGTHDLSDKVQYLEVEIYDLPEKIQHLDSKTHDLAEKIQHLENKTLDLPEKLNANNKELLTMSESQKQVMTSLETVETQLAEIKGNSHVENLKIEIQESKTNVEILCQLLNKRLRPVEELRKSLNQRASARDDNVRKLCELMKEVAAITPRLQTLEMQCLKSNIGFSARTRLTVIYDGILSSYDRVYFNADKCFNRNTGIFTAPKDGLYVACISQRLVSEGWVFVNVQHCLAGSDKTNGRFVCESSVEVTNTSASDVGLVQMKAGDILFSEAGGRGNPELRMQFSCFQL